MEPDFRLILDTLGEPVIAAERTGRIIYANRAAEELLGWPSGGLRGAPITAIIPPHLRSRHTAGFNRYRSTWQPRIFGKRVRLPARRRNGVEVPIELTLTSFRGRGGQELYLASLHDVALRAAPERSTAARDSFSALLEAASRLEIGPATPEALLARKVEEAVEHHFDASVAQLWICDDGVGAIRLASFAGESAPEPPALVVECAVTRTVVRLDGGGAPLTVVDVEASGPIGSLVAQPVWRGGALGGVLLYGLRATLTAEALRPVEVFCRLVGGALDRFYRQACESRNDREARRLAALAEIAALMANGASLERGLALIVTRALELTGLDEGFVLLRDGARGSGVIRAAAGSKQLSYGERLPPDSSAASIALGSGRMEVLADHRLLPDALPQLRQRGVRAAIAAPIVVRGEVRAALQLASRRSGRAISPEDIETADLLAGQAAALLASTG